MQLDPKSFKKAKLEKNVGNQNPSYQAAPMTESPTQRKMPRLLQKYGEMFWNKNKSQSTFINQTFIFV